MKSTTLSGPVWMGLATLGIIACLVRAGWQLQNENETLRASAATFADADLLTGTHARSDSKDGPPEGALQAQDLRSETQREIAARATVEAKISELESRLPARDGEVLVSLGRIEQIGQRAGKAVMILSQHAAAQRSAQKPVENRPKEAVAKEQSAIEEFLGLLGELRNLESDPREIARFQAATLREVFGLDEATAARATTFLETEFARLKLQKLTANFRPESEPVDWDLRRDAAMTELAARLRPLIPPNHEQLQLLPGILSLGGGFRTQVSLKPDGHGSVQMTLPLFPSLF